jgi:multidrug efflux system membrane fusion protein
MAICADGAGWVWRAALVAGLLLAAAGCGRHGKGAPVGGSDKPPSQTKLQRNVELAQVTQQRLPAFVETVGALEAEGQTDVAAGVTGIVDEVLFREGQWVDTDTILVKVDQRRYEALMAQTEANLKRAEAAFTKAESNEKRAEAMVASAGDTLELKQTIQENIQRSGAAARREESQEARVNVEVARSMLRVARADAEVAKSELAAARSDVKAAVALRDLAAHNLFRSRVRPPYRGQINQRRVTPGTYLEEKTVIATIADLSRLRLVGYIPEKATPLVRQMLNEEQRARTVFLVGPWAASPWAALGAYGADLAGEGPAAYRLEFELRPYPKQKFYGRIFYLSTVASPDTHMFECKAEVPNRGFLAELRPGYTAKIRCPLPGNAESYVIPEEAVRASERGFIAFRPRPVVRKDGSVEWVAQAVTLELGVRVPGSVEVLKGLRPGDWIVRKGAEALEENTPLAIPAEQLAQLPPPKFRP